eukprot:jgi/Mesen1/5554/ME000280S04685
MVLLHLSHVHQPLTVAVEGSCMQPWHIQLQGRDTFYMGGAVFAPGGIAGGGGGRGPCPGPSRRTSGSSGRSSRTSIEAGLQQNFASPAPSGEDMKMNVTPSSLWEELKPSVSYLNPQQLDTVRDALELAYYAHDGQKRKSGEPYIIHPVEVASILGDLTITAGLLHDTVEDTQVVTFEQIEDLYGPVVRRIVEGETKVSKLGKMTCHADVVAQDVKADDLRQMFLAMTEEKYIATETLQVFAPLARLLGMYRIKSELEEMSFMYAYPDQYASLKHRIDFLCKEQEEVVLEARDVLVNALEKDKFLGVATLEARVQTLCKEPYSSIYKKMQESRCSVEEIRDIAQIRTEEMDKLADGSDGDGAAAKVGGDGAARMAGGSWTRPTPSRGWGGNCANNADISRRVSWLNSIREWQEEFVGNMSSREFVDTITGDLLGSRVFVFTPKGEVKNLPKGATVVDYAYHIHTDVGNKMVAAKVNGNIVSPTYTLANAEGTSQRKNFELHRQWVEHAKTRSARHKLTKFLKEQAHQLGEEITEEAVQAFSSESDSSGTDSKPGGAAESSGPPRSPSSRRSLPPFSYFSSSSSRGAAPNSSPSPSP